MLTPKTKRPKGEVCVCELVPLFDGFEPTVSQHLEVVSCYIVPGALDELAGWIG